MENPFRNPGTPFVIQSSIYGKPIHFSTPAGMLQPKELQPPPMYGPRGSTVPPKYLANYNNRNYTPNRNFKSNRNDKPFHAPKSNQQQYWCEACDKCFKYPNQLEDHKSEHQTCGIDGCTFVAHISILKSHREMQHQSGLYARLIKLETPEDIQKWRDERRKRYPTTENVQLRQLIQEQKLNRGERLNESKSRFGNKRQRNNQTSNDNISNPPANKKRKRSNYSKNKKVIAPITPKIEIVKNELNYDSDDTEDRVRFRGTGAIANYEKVSEQPKNNLTMLFNMYGSESETENEEEDTVPSSVINKESATIKIEEKTVDTLEDGEIEDSETDQMKPVTQEQTDKVVSPGTSQQDNSKTNIIKSKNKRQRRRKKNNGKNNKDEQGPSPKFNESIRRTQSLNYDRLAKAPPNTLLATLLKPEILHERNVLLQCVRFVVKNRFFGIGAENKKATVNSTVETTSAVSETLAESPQKNEQDEINPVTDLKSESNSITIENIVNSATDEQENPKLD